jgi:ribose transport system substrate-binding protein
MKRFWKRLSVVLSIGMVLILMVACGQKETTETTETTDSTSTSDTSNDMTEVSDSGSEDLPYIAVVCKGYQHQYWQAVKSGMQQAADELGATFSFEAPETEAQVDRQIELIDAAIAKKADAIAVACLDSKAVIPTFDKAAELGIPLLTFDSGSESDKVSAHISTDAIAASALAADKMAELLDGKGEVAVISGDQTSLTHIERRDGFVNQIKEKYPDIEIVDIQYSMGDDLKALDITVSLIQAHPNLAGIYLTGEPSVNGAISAFEQLKMEPGKIKVIGFDAGKKQKDAIQSGIVSGSITQNPVGMGYKTIETALKLLKGEAVEPSVDSGFYYYDKTNMDDPQIAACLYD